MADELFVDQDEVEGTASGVWSRMLAGNRRFAEGKPEHPNRGAEAREALVDTHAPEAAILSCALHQSLSYRELSGYTLLNLLL